MDIDLLAKMVKEAVMDHDCVTLPGMGSFVAEVVPATFADRGYTILPPYRRLYFSPKQGEDHLLAQLYARSNPSISEQDAVSILEEFIAGMKEALKVRKTLVLNGLGRLRATRENHFFFVADEDLDIYPAGFGLQPISLKTHQETPEEVAAAVTGLAGILEGSPEAPAEEEMPDQVGYDEGQETAPVVELEPETGPVVELAPDAAEEPEPEPVEEPEPLAVKPAKKPVGKGWKVLGRVVLVLLCLAAVAALAIAVVGRLAPEWLDQFLYSPQELEILRK